MTYTCNHTNYTPQFILLWVSLFSLCVSKHNSRSKSYISRKTQEREREEREIGSKERRKKRSREVISAMEVSRKMANMLGTERDLNFKETELCLGLPGGCGGGVGHEVESSPKTTGKRGFSETIDLKLNLQSKKTGTDLNKNIENGSKEKNLLPSCTKDPAKPPTKAQVVGWPPVRSYRKIIMANQKNSSEESEKASSGSAAFVKVCMDGAPYLRKVDLKMYKSYQELSDALAKMFSSFTMGNYGSQGMIDFMNESKLMDLLNSSDYVPTYEDKDGDWMLVGDVPWEMFVESCKRLRIMKGSEAIGLAPRAMEKCKSRA